MGFSSTVKGAAAWVLHKTKNIFRSSTKSSSPLEEVLGERRNLSRKKILLLPEFVDTVPVMPEEQVVEPILQETSLVKDTKVVDASKYGHLYERKFGEVPIASAITLTMLAKHLDPNLLLAIAEQIEKKGQISRYPFQKDLVAHGEFLGKLALKIGAVFSK